MKKITKDKIIGKLVWWRIKYFRNSPLYPLLYLSYWHYLIHHNKKHYQENATCYYSARPNPGAGIGHQMANWIAGFWYARYFHLKFAHIQFSNSTWEKLLGLGENEVTVNELKEQGFKIRKLPLFNENKKEEIEINKKIINSYYGKKVIFLAEQDQFYKDLYKVSNDLKKKFYQSQVRQQDKLIYSNQNFNIAIHVRRGDIMSNLNDPGLAMRYLRNDYFEKVLRQVVDNIQISKPIHIYFFSQGTPSDYPEFSTFQNLHWCLDMNAQYSFLHLVYADLLITSKSSFSYKPALLNNGIKVCPKNFWHGYPNTKDWILCENDGTFNIDKLKALL